MNFTLLIVGADANAYYMARCYHELTNKKAYLIAQNPIWITDESNITIMKYNKKLHDEKILLEELNNFYQEHQKEKILLVSATENYIELISKNKEKLKTKFYFNYADVDIIHTLSNKEDFYKKYMDNEFIKLPKTIYYNTKSKKEPQVTFSYPIIIKAANVVLYRSLHFPNQNKIYKVNNKEELNSVINDIRNGGYLDTLIIQEYIEGDDSTLFDSVIYADTKGKVKRISFAQIGLQEHKKDLVGNAAVLINGYNLYDNNNDIIERIKNFAEYIGITGFAEFDLKYDKKAKDFKLLEINPRQGRSSYYLTGLGCNLIELLKKDLIDKEKLDYQILDKEVILSYVPKGIIKKYIVNNKYKEKALSLYKEHINPIAYNKDLSLKRRYLLFRKSLRYYNDYKNGYWTNK